ncbi:PfkB family carbohydrate kinase [Candidatus Coxiella mudrowiae]|uniref:PfkB family carbohydrate kinase n=1 Tax=Candidatus Coxiella mudrowiae TaxID=2054173 RepID=UPI001F15A0BD|nr:PfkB family carbohydrate kinase [Candidatus Coxiella mudrowiae]
MKQGDKGYWLSDRTGQRQITIEKAPQVVNTSGAGYSFNGVYLEARLEGQRLPRGGFS